MADYCLPVTLHQDKPVSVPEELTQPIEIVDLRADFDLIDLAVGYKAQRVRAMQCNGRLADIAQIKE